MIIEPSNYTYETMPDYEDAVDGAVEIPVTGEEIEIRYAHEVVYDEAHNLHLEIFTPFQMAHPERTWPCITFIQGSAWMKQYVYQKVGMIARLAQRGYVVAIVEYRHSGIAHFPAQIIDAKNAVRFLRAHADEYKLNPAQMFFMGDSSGGQVSSVAAVSKTFADDISDDCRSRHYASAHGICSFFRTAECDNQTSNKACNRKPQLSACKFSFPVNHSFSPR